MGSEYAQINESTFIIKMRRYAEIRSTLPPEIRRVIDRAQYALRSAIEEFQIAKKGAVREEEYYRTQNKEILDGANELIQSKIQPREKRLDEAESRILCLIEQHKNIILREEAIEPEFDTSVLANFIIFPVGEWPTSEKLVDSIKDKQRLSVREVNFVKQKYLFLKHLATQPNAVGIIGQGRFAGYMGVKLNNGFTVFDHVASGNAVYIVEKESDWLEICQLSKFEALKHSGVRRLYHVGFWERKVLDAINLPDVEISDSEFLDHLQTPRQPQPPPVPDSA